MKSIAIYYLNTVLPAVQKAARECGYAVGLHGSMERDLDLIAVPWTPDAKGAAELVEAVRCAVSGFIIETGTPGAKYDAAADKFVPAVVVNPAAKPHGRLAWSIQLGGAAYVDLSVMPRNGPCAACGGTGLMPGDPDAPRDSVRSLDVPCPECRSEL